MSPDAQIGAFVDAANTHPVFELTLTPSDTPGARISVSRRQGDGRTPQPRGPTRSSGSSSPPARTGPAARRPALPVPAVPSHRTRATADPSTCEFLSFLRQDESCRLRYVRQLRPAAQKCLRIRRATLHFWARQGELSRRGGRRRVRRGGARAGGGGRARRRRRGRRRGRCASGGRVARRRHSIRSETGGPRAWPARQRASCTTPRAGERGPRRRVGRTGRAGAWRQTASAWRQTASAWRQTASCARRPTSHCRCIRGRPSSPGLG